MNPGWHARPLPFIAFRSEDLSTCWSFTWFKSRVPVSRLCQEERDLSSVPLRRHVPRRLESSNRSSHAATARTAPDWRTALALRSSKMKSRGNRMAVHRCPAPDFCRFASYGGRRENKEAHSPARHRQVLVRQTHRSNPECLTLAKVNPHIGGEAWLVCTCRPSRSAAVHVLSMHLPSGFDMCAVVMCRFVGHDP